MKTVWGKWQQNPNHCWSQPSSNPTRDRHDNRYLTFRRGSETHCPQPSLDDQHHHHPCEPQQVRGGARQVCQEAEDGGRNVGCMVGQVVQPGIVLAVVPLSIKREETCYKFKSSRLLPVLRKSICHTELAFFSEYFLPLTAKCLTRSQMFLL